MNDRYDTYRAAEPKMVTKRDVCLVLGISLPTVNRLMAAGDIPYRKLGTKVLIPRWWLDEVIGDRTSYRPPTLVVGKRT